ncbi:MAG: response regulator [Parabacteroides sp.]|nr:response regulator [Parabacteroides sp.]
MKKDSVHITRKVVLGYILLIGIAICAVAYIYTAVVRIAGEEEPGAAPRQKVYLITGTLALLYESEAVNQLVGTEQNGYTRYNRVLNQAQRNIDSLRLLVTDSVQLLKIDTIDNLIERKRRNTRRLLETLQEANAEHLYRTHIEKVIAVQDTVVEQVKIKEEEIVSQDTVWTRKEPKGFFKRLAEVFAPSRADSDVVVSTIRHIQTDTLTEAFNPADTIVSVLKSIQDSVAGQRKELNRVLQQRAGNLRYDNGLITSRINQLLRDIEQEEVNASLERMQEKQHLLRHTSHVIAAVAVVSLLIALFFLLFIGRDISRSFYYRKQLEKAKQYAEDLLRIREKLMLMISHDIRAPLSSILGYIELLRRSRMGERQLYYLENMTASSNHILALVNDLLDFHRLESNQIEIHPVPFRIPALFREIYDSFLPLAEKKGLTFVFNLKEETLPERLYRGDTIRIRQVAGNLLSNAIKFTPAGRIVLVVSLAAGADKSARLVFQVVDAGPGIPEAERERVFGEFTRLPGTEKEEGFGLGLSITRKLVELMGGTLALESVAGKGSTFIVELPLLLADGEYRTPVAEEVAEETAGKIRRPDAGRVRCLLVDDDPLQLTVTREMLARNGVEVTCCLRPSEVTGLLRAHPADIVVTDIQMPGFDGFAVLKSIRESDLPCAATLPVIALSASVAGEKEHYLEAGFTGFLNKPFTAAGLLGLINDLLQRGGTDVVEPDFSSLTAFAGDDSAARSHILSTFCEETRKSLSGLQEALRASDRQQASRIAHKLIPLFSMLGVSGTVAFLRQLEQAGASLAADEWERLAGRAIAGVEAVVADAQRKRGE